MVNVCRLDVISQMQKIFQIYTGSVILDTTQANREKEPGRRKGGNDIPVLYPKQSVPINHQRERERERERDMEKNIFVDAQICMRMKSACGRPLLLRSMELAEPADLHSTYGATVESWALEVFFNFFNNKK